MGIWSNQNRYRNDHFLHDRSGANLVRIVLLSLFTLPFWLHAQNIKKIELIGADVMTYDAGLGRDVNKVSGNVIFQHENTILYCDSAYLYSQNNSVDAMGRVHIKANDSTNIYGDSLRYSGNTRIAEIHRNVRLIDNQIILTTNHLTYDMRRRYATYYDGGKIVDFKNTLTSNKGYYYSDTKNAFFKDSVVLINQDYTVRCDTMQYNTATEVTYFYGPTEITSKENFIYCEKGWYDTQNDIAEFRHNAFMKNDRHTLSGDSIYYVKQSGTGLAYGNVSVTDSIENMILKGDFARYEEKLQFSIVTGNALAIQVDERDSLFLHADTLKAVFDTVERKAEILFAFHQAKFYRHDLQGMCDSLVYRFSDSTIAMYREPVLWSEEKQLTADTIYIHTAFRKVKTLALRNSSFMIACDDSTETRYNQVKGVNMTGHFDDGELKQIRVYEQAETVYFMRENDGRRTGTNKATGRNMIIYWQDNQISAITFLEKPEGTLHPENEVPVGDLLLRNFNWLENWRPQSKEDVFIWK